MRLWLIAYAPIVHAFDFSAALRGSGNASLTHYSIPQGAGASVACGCARQAADYPTAAINQYSFSSSVGSGPACGTCFNITLLEAPLSDPPFVCVDRESALSRRPTRPPSIVIKVTDSCPKPPNTDPAKTWCGSTPTESNQLGQYVHFDLSSPSLSIPSSFFPSDVAKYGYDDFGVWQIAYSSVDCSHWTGSSNRSTLGIDSSLHKDQGCCPANPLATNSTCAVLRDPGDLSSDATAFRYPLLFLSIVAIALSLCLSGAPRAE